MTASACDPGGHCITCADTGVPMRVLSVRGDAAVCTDPEGATHDVAVELVGAVAPQDRLLVHAGVAIAHLEAER